MAFTYTVGTSRGRVRLRIGDTKEQSYSLTDAEVDEAIILNSDVDNAAVIAHEWFLIRLADYIASQAGGQSHQFNQRFEQHKTLHKQLVARASRGEMHCYAGGIEQTRIDDSKDDTEYPDPFARVGQDDRDYDATDESLD